MVRHWFKPNGRGVCPPPAASPKHHRPAINA